MNCFIHSEFARVYDAGVTTTEIAVFFRIAVAAGRKNTCTVPVAQLARWVGVTDRCIRKCVKRLEQLGLIGVERTNGGAGTANTYSVKSGNKSSENPAAPLSCDDRHKQADSLSGTVTSNDRGGGTLVTHNPEQNDIKPGTERPPIKNIYKRIPPEERIKRAPAGERSLPYRHSEMPVKRGGGFSKYEIFNDAANLCGDPGGWGSVTGIPAASWENFV